MFTKYAFSFLQNASKDVADVTSTERLIQMLESGTSSGK